MTKTDFSEKVPVPPVLAVGVAETSTAEELRLDNDGLRAAMTQARNILRAVVEERRLSPGVAARIQLAVTILDGEAVR